MHNILPIEIALSKSKLAKLLIFSLLFLVAGSWILIYQPTTSNFIFNNPVLRNAAGVLSVIMGAAGIWFFTKKLLDKRPGLIIDETGVVDNAGATSLGRVPWTDITAIQEKIVQASMFSKQKFILLMLKNPEEYIAKETNGFKKKAMAMNTKYSGTPVNISVNGLAISFDELKTLLQQRLADSKTKAVL